MKTKQPDSGKMNSYEVYQQNVTKLTEKLSKVNDVIKKTAGQIDQGNSNSQLEKTSQKLEFNMTHLEKSVFKILIMGEFKRGKSTFINALLGKSILPAYTKPCTDVINEVSFGKVGKALVLKKSGKELEVSIEELRDHVTIDGKLNQEDDKTEVARIEWPISLCEKGVEIIDTPGLNEHKSRTKVTNSYLPNADAIIFVLSAEQACTMTELEVIENHLFQHGYTDIFFVCNRINNVRAKERDEVMSYVKDKIGKFTSDQQTKIHFIDALAALDAREEGKEVDDTFSYLEKCIQEHLVDKRGQLRLNNISNEVHYNLAYLSSHLQDRLEKVREDLSVSVADLEKQLESLSQSEELTERVHQMWEEGSTKIQDKIKESFQVEASSQSFQTQVSRQLDIIFETRGRKAFEDAAFMDSEVNAIMESWVSNWFSLRAKPDLQVLLKEIMLDMSNEVYKTLSAFQGENVKHAISQDPVNALFNDVSLGGFAVGSSTQLQIAKISSEVTETKKVSNAGIGAAVLTGLDIILTGGGASLLFAAVFGAGGGYFLSGQPDDSHKIKQNVLSAVTDKFNKDKSVLFKRIAEASAQVLGNFDEAFVHAVDQEIERVKSSLEQKKRDALLSKESKEDLIKNINDLNQKLDEFSSEIKRFNKAA